MNASSPSPWTADRLLVLIPSSPLPHPTLHHRVQLCKCTSSSPMTTLFWQDPPTEGSGRTWGYEGKGEPRALLPLLLVLVESLAVAEPPLGPDRILCMFRPMGDPALDQDLPSAFELPACRVIASCVAHLWVASPIHSDPWCFHHMYKQCGFNSLL